MREFRPKISIMLGSYKEAAVIEETLRHLLEEVKYPNLEVLIAIDTNEDETLDIAKSFSEKHKNLIIDFHHERRGVAKALDSALKKASGEIIVHFGSEFRFFDPKNCLQKLIKYFEDSNVGAVTFDIKFPEYLEQDLYKNINSRAQVFLGKLVSDWRRTMFPVITGEFRYPIICHSFRRHLVEGLDADTINDDAEFSYSVLDRGYKIVFAKDFLFYALAEPVSAKGIMLRQTRTSAGWFKLAEKRKIDFVRYYLSILGYLITHMKRYKSSEILALIYNTPLYFISLLRAYKKRKLSPVKIWAKYKRFEE